MGATGWGPLGATTLKLGSIGATGAPGVSFKTGACAPTGGTEAKLALSLSLAAGPLAGTERTSPLALECLGGWSSGSESYSWPPFCLPPPPGRLPRPRPLDENPEVPGAPVGGCPEGEGFGDLERPPLERLVPLSRGFFGAFPENPACSVPRDLEPDGEDFFTL